MDPNGELYESKLEPPRIILDISEQINQEHWIGLYKSEHRISDRIIEDKTEVSISDWIGSYHFISFQIISEQTRSENIIS